MREYEVVFILKGNTEGPAADKIQEKVREIVKKEKEELLGIQFLGKKALAYPIEKEVRGNYYLVNIVGQGKVVNELERYFRLHEDVIRFLTVKIRDDVELEKRKEEYATVLKSKIEEKGETHESHIES
ncbi:MAG: 30S ribosomal protein S6 [bacterium]|nr:30S ribosomal protein S6 [bacterium]